MNKKFLFKMYVILNYKPYMLLICNIQETRKYERLGKQSDADLVLNGLSVSL